MGQEIIQDIHLNDELISSAKLIEIGLGEIQNIDLSNDFYHLPSCVLNFLYF